MTNFDQNPKQKIEKAKPYIRNIYSSLLASLMSVSFSYTVLNGYLKTYEYNEIEFHSYAEKAFLNILFPIVIIATAGLVFNYFDNLDLFNKREYWNSDRNKALISRTPYLIGFAVNMLFATAIFTRGFDMAVTFFFPEADIVIARILSVISMAVLRLLQLISLQNKWDMEIDNPLFAEKAVFKRNRDPKKFKPRQMILQPIGYFFVFSLAAYFCALFGFPLFMVIFMIIISTDILSLILSATIAIIVSVYAVRLIYNTRKRAILIKKLRQMEREKLAFVKMHGSKYLSATLTFLPFRVEITDTAGEVYNCVVVTNSKINAPMFFKSNEYMVEHGFHLRGGALLSKMPPSRWTRAIDISQMGGKENPTNLIMGYRTVHKLDFPNIEGKRTVIINPTPSTAFATDGREYRTIDTGEDMKDYIIYTATGFFNHIERQSRKDRRDYDY